MTGLGENNLAMSLAKRNIASHKIKGCTNCTTTNIKAELRFLSELIDFNEILSKDSLKVIRTSDIDNLPNRKNYSSETTFVFVLCESCM